MSRNNVKFRITQTLEAHLNDMGLLRIESNNHAAGCADHLSEIASNTTYLGALDAITEHLKLMHDPEHERKELELIGTLQSGASVLIKAWISDKEYEAAGMAAAVTRFMKDCGAGRRAHE